MKDLYIYTVYKNPSDYDYDCLVVRATIISSGTMRMEETPLLVVDPDQYDDIKALMESKGLYRKPRLPGDDPVILETWI